MSSASAYDRGHAAGYAAAVDREHAGDATAEDADNGVVWFTIPADEHLDADAATEYERGWVLGWSEYLSTR
ncbi:hypothetical protein [Rhodococcus sp. 11-3]|uniref:hypothetical protein n=1 Tax=Rhodococcus sp. 11-3 TaxID=2854796 RepID=UPI00203D760A|nr:hypothetical protein [Rhodococcus sp. 11-3]USC18463.1 hypothetical protein KZJ41_28210 [Rhodococcus sp. 11-3]